MSHAPRLAAAANLERQQEGAVGGLGGTSSACHQMGCLPLLLCFGREWLAGHELRSARSEAMESEVVETYRGVEIVRSHLTESGRPRDRLEARVGEWLLIGDLDGIKRQIDLQ